MGTENIERRCSQNKITSRDPLKKEEIITHPPGDVHYIDTEDEEKKEKTNVNRTRKRTRKPPQKDQSSSDSGSLSDSSTDSSSGSDSDRENEDTKKKDNTQCVVAKNADVKIKIKSPVKKDIRGGKKSPNNNEETNKKERIPIKRKASGSPDNNGDSVEKKGPDNKAKRVNEVNNDVTSSVTGPAPRKLDRDQKSDEKEAMTNESNQNEPKQDDKPRVKKQRERITAPERNESDREGRRHEEPTSSRRRYDSDSRSPSYRRQYRRGHYPDSERGERKKHRRRNEYPRRRTYSPEYRRRDYHDDYESRSRSPAYTRYKIYTEDRSDHRRSNRDSPRRQRDDRQRKHSSNDNERYGDCKSPNRNRETSHEETISRHRDDEYLSNESQRNEIRNDNCLRDEEGDPIICRECNKELSVKNLIEQHLCYVKKCEQCKAMFSNEEDFITHNKNCKKLKRIDKFGEGDIEKCVRIMDIIDEEKYKNIPMSTWPDLIKHGAAVIKNQQIRSAAENKSEETEEVRESGGDETKDKSVQIINTHNTYGEQVKAGQWGYRPSTKNKVGFDRFDRQNKRFAEGNLTLESELNESFRSFTNSEKRAIRGLAEIDNRRDMEVIFTSEVTLTKDALCKGVGNLSSITRKRDPPTFRSQLNTIISLLRREFDRVGFPATYFTTTEDINATLTLVEKQLKELTTKVKMKDLEQIEK